MKKVTYTLVLEAVPDARNRTPAYRLKLLLKNALRSYSFRAVQVTEQPDPPKPVEPPPEVDHDQDRGWHVLGRSAGGMFPTPPGTT